MGTKYTFSLNKNFEILNKDTGYNKIEIGSDRSGFGILELREYDFDDNLMSIVSISYKQAELLVEALNELIEDSKRGGSYGF
jgi:hypothetical protein